MSDIKYIIKRVIIGVLISIILMYIGSIKVNAETYSLPTCYGSSYSFGTSGGGNRVYVGASYSCYGGSCFCGINAQNYAYVDFLTNVYYNQGVTTNLARTINFLVASNWNISVSYDGQPCQTISGGQSEFGTTIFGVTCPNVVYLPNRSVNISLVRDTTSKSDYFVGISQFYAVNTTILSANEMQNVMNSVNSTILGQNAYFNEINNKISDIDRHINEQTQQQHQDAQEIKDAITSEEAPTTNDVNNNTNDWASNNANNGVINQLVQLPITLLNSIVNGLSSSCSSYNFGSLFGTDLIFPCVNMHQVLGASLWGLIDLIISGIFVYKFGTKLVQIFNNFTNLKGGQVDQLYGGGN